MGTVSLYFDAYNASEAWSTSPGNGVDGQIDTYASTNTAGQVQNLNSLSALAATFGQITRVALRTFGYKSGGIQASTLILRPVFTAGDGPNQSFTLMTTPAWSLWFDITYATNAPNPWTWAAVVGLGCDVQAQPSAGRTVYFSRVEVEVEFDDLPAPGAGLAAGATAGTVHTVASAQVAGAGSGLLAGTTAGSVSLVGAPVEISGAGSGLLAGATSGQVTSGVGAVGRASGALAGGSAASVKVRVVPFGTAEAPGLGALGGRRATAAAGLGHGGRQVQPHGPGLGHSGREQAGAAGLGHSGQRRPKSTQMGSW